MTGIPVTIGGKEYLVPRLRIGPYKRAMRILEALDKVPPESDPLGIGRIDSAGAAMLELLRENYPDLAADDLTDGIAFADLDDTLKALLAAAGRKAAPAGEAGSP